MDQVITQLERTRRIGRQLLIAQRLVQWVSAMVVDDPYPPQPTV